MRSPNKCATSTFLVWLAQTKPLVGLLIARVNLVSALRNRSAKQIQAIRNSPHYPGAPGVSRPVTPWDTAPVPKWLLAVSQEATPHDPTPNREKLEKAAGNGQYLFCRQS